MTCTVSCIRKTASYYINFFLHNQTLLHACILIIIIAYLPKLIVLPGNEKELSYNHIIKKYLTMLHCNNYYL